MSTYTERAKKWRKLLDIASYTWRCSPIGDSALCVWENQVDPLLKEAGNWAADCDRLTAELAEARAERDSACKALDDVCSALDWRGTCSVDEEYAVVSARWARGCMSELKVERDLLAKERDEARAECERLRAQELAIARAVGITYEADGCDIHAGPHEVVLREVKRLERLRRESEPVADAEIADLLRCVESYADERVALATRRVGSGNSDLDREPLRCAEEILHRAIGRLRRPRGGGLRELRSWIERQAGNLSALNSDYWSRAAAQVTKAILAEIDRLLASAPAEPERPAERPGALSLIQVNLDDERFPAEVVHAIDALDERLQRIELALAEREKGGA